MSGSKLTGGLRIVPTVPAPEPTEQQKMHQRLKAMPKPEGMVQCHRCGGRTVMSTWNGSMIKDGRYKAGTVIEDKICYGCHMRGMWTPMIPSPPKVVKEPKPRRTKPRSVK